MNVLADGCHLKTKNRNQTRVELDLAALRRRRHRVLDALPHDQLVNVVEPENHAGVIKGFDFFAEGILRRVHTLQNISSKCGIALDRFHDLVNGGAVRHQFLRKLGHLSGQLRNLFYEFLHEFGGSSRSFACPIPCRFLPAEWMGALTIRKPAGRAAVFGPLTARTCRNSRRQSLLMSSTFNFGRIRWRTDSEFAQNWK